MLRVVAVAEKELLVMLEVVVIWFNKLALLHVHRSKLLLRTRYTHNH